MKRCFSLLVAVLLLVPVLRAEILEQILVKVNGEIITKTDLEKLQIVALRERPNGNPAGMSNADLANALADVTPGVLVNAVNELLLLQRAKVLGYAVTDETFNSVLDSIKKDNKLENEQEFEAALKQEGLTLAELRETLTKRMLVGQVQQREVMSHIDVSENDQRAYYDAHPSEFQTVSTVTLREILIASPAGPKGVNVAEDEEARRKAEAALARVNAGEAFDKVAAEVSDAASKANGGLIGTIQKSELADELEKMLSAMKPGDVTPVVRMAGGYEIFQLESAVDAAPLPFDQVKGRIFERLATERQASEMQKYLKKLRDQALIEWKNDEVKKAYEAGLATQEKQGN